MFEEDLQLILTEYADALFEASAESFRDLARDRAPEATGALKNSGEIEVNYHSSGTTTVVGRVIFDSEYASFTDVGADPHEIWPSRAKALRFNWPDGPDGDRIYYFGHVNHPGQAGTNWFSTTTEQWSEIVQDAIDSDDWESLVP